jgi:AraC family transcriptional regulator, arabinose operon regulatory protein
MLTHRGLRQGVTTAMLVPTVQIVDPTALPKPSYDAEYERGLVSDYYEVRRGYHVMRRSGTLTSYLAYTVSGQGFFRDRQNRLIVVGGGDLVLIEAQTYQEYGIWNESRHWHCHWVHFDAQAHWARWLPLPVASGLAGVSFLHIPSRALQRQVSDLFFELQARRTRPELWRHALALNILERILILSHRTGGAARQVDPRVSRVLQLIENSAPVPPRVDQLKAISGLSMSRLAHLFKAEMGVSMRGVVTRVRLRLAQNALHAPGATLEQAAECSGFESPYSFSNWFLKQTGLRPGQYRSKWRARESAIRPDKPWLKAARARGARAALNGPPSIEERPDASEGPLAAGYRLERMEALDLRVQSPSTERSQK